jgi:prepilin-type N-terminal cleavage/methylation domain-containing protein
MRRLYRGEIRFARKIYRDLKGFTMVEMLVVVGLLGILDAIAIPKVISFSDEGGAGS